MQQFTEFPISTTIIFEFIARNTFDLDENKMYCQMRIQRLEITRKENHGLNLIEMRLTDCRIAAKLQSIAIA